MLGGCSAPPPDGDDEESALAIETEVRGFLDQYSEAVGDGRWEDVVAMYADDPGFSWAEDGRIAYRSTAEIREAFEGLRTQFTSASTEFVDPKIVVLGPDVAHVTASVRQRFTVSEGDDFSFDALVTAVVVREQSGWRFIAGHTSTRRAPNP